MVDRLTWKHPSMKLLLASPAVQALRLVGQQFPGAARALGRGPQTPHATNPPTMERMAWQAFPQPVTLNSAGRSSRACVA